MRSRLLAAVSVTASLLLATSGAALAQGPAPHAPAGAPPAPAPVKPYKPVTITAPTPVADPSFEAFRKQLGGIAEKKDRKALAGLVAQDFFWMGENGDKADKKKPGIDNLAKAIQLDGKDAQGWEVLGGAATDPTGMNYPDRKDTICAPSDPTFNGPDLEALAKSTGTDPGDWAYPTETGVEVHSGAQPNSPVIEKLGLAFVRVLPDNTPPSNNQQQAPMVKVATPSGKTGFVPADALNPLGNDQICYSKDSGGWKISGYIGGSEQ